ncbi:MAG: helix-hairpin-helix domain-containing protein [Nitrospinae bacterium]|nr:helix-hairpin-helix domain-containing protein [Nitrospinota bacterium]
MRKTFMVKSILYFIVASFLVTSIFSGSVYAADKPSKPAEEKKAVNIIVNINKASADEIATLPGIGDKTAKLIVEYRDKNGSFKKPEDIRKVKGVGEKLFEKIKGSITVGEETEKKK